MSRTREGTVHRRGRGSIPMLYSSTSSVRSARRATYLPLRGASTLLALTLDPEHVHTLRRLSALLTQQAGRFVSPHDVVLLLLEWAGQQQRDDGVPPGMFDPVGILGEDNLAEGRKRDAEAKRKRLQRRAAAQKAAASATSTSSTSTSSSPSPSSSPSSSTPPKPPSSPSRKKTPSSPR